MQSSSQLAVALVTTFGQVWVISSVLPPNESHTFAVWLPLLAFTIKFYNHWRIIAQHFDPTAPYPVGLLTERSGLLGYFAAGLDLLHHVCVVTWPTIMIQMLRPLLPASNASQVWDYASEVLLIPALSLAMLLGLLMLEPFSRGLLYTEGAVAVTRFTGRLFYRFTSALPLSPRSSPNLGATFSKTTVPLTEKSSQMAEQIANGERLVLHDRADSLSLA